MPKSQYIEPIKKLSEKYDKPLEIPCYEYDKDLKFELSENGNLKKEDVLEIYRQMILIRHFEEMLLENKATNKYRGLEFEYDGPLHVSIGQEAVCVGQSYFMSKDDFVFGTHRNHGETIAKGISAINKMSDQELNEMMSNHWDGKVLKNIENYKTFNSTKEKAHFFYMYSVLLEIYTKELGLNKGLGGSMHMFFAPLGIYPNNAVVGASASIAIGAAMYKLQSQDPGIVVANFGDGALACGPAWESLNLMAMDQYKLLWDKPYNKRPPFILNIINNQYAMGGQPYGETHGHKGVARLGMAINPEQAYAERINGQDVLAVIDLMKRKTKLSIDGEGPIINEIMTYRYDGHSSADGVQPYRDKQEIEDWKQFDPINLWKKQILENKIYTEEELKQEQDKILELVFDIYKLTIDPKISKSMDFTINDVLDDMMLNPNTFFETKSTKKPELLQTLEENPRMNQLAKKARYIYDENGKEISALRQYQIRDAIFEAVAQYAVRDPLLLVFGEEHRDWGGPYAVWRGLTELLPYHRFFNTPIAEAAIVGCAVGYALCGGKSVVEIMYFDFLFRAGDEITNQMAKWRAMSGGLLNCPLVLRANIGASYGAQHSQDYTSVIAHVPGLKLVQPVTPYDAKGLMKAALDDPNPVIYVETQSLYGYGEKFNKDGVPKEEYSIKIGQPIIRRKGKDLTIATLGATLYPALEAAEIFAKEYDIDVEVIDLRSAVPLEYEILIESIKKTGKVILANNGVERNNFMRHVASTCQEIAFDYLDAPIIVLGARNWIMPGAGLDKFLYPQAPNFLAAYHTKIKSLPNFVAQRNETNVELLRRNKYGV